MKQTRLSSGSGAKSNTGRVWFGDNLRALERIDDESIDLIYIDPPFNTGHRQARTQVRTERSEAGDRVGFKGKRYRTIPLGRRSFADAYEDYLGFLEPRVEHAHRVLKPSGTLYLHLDYREVHYCKVMADQVFGRACFLNEIIWAYDYGARTTRRWPPKHDNILVYVKDPKRYVFNVQDIDRIPYMAPGLVGAEKAARGKLPTDTWWHTIVSPTGKEKLGYPTQKPLALLTRMVLASSPKDGMVLDFFAGSGTTGAAALDAGRNFLLVDDNPEAIDVMRRRFVDREEVVFETVPEK